MIVADAEAVNHLQDVGDLHRTDAQASMEFEDALVEIVWMVLIGTASMCLERRGAAVITVFVGELVDPMPTEVELLGDEVCVHVMADNDSTDPEDLILFQLHPIMMQMGEVEQTKSKPDST